MAKATTAARYLSDVFRQSHDNPRVHLRLLDAFASRGQHSPASPADGIELLTFLRKALDGFRERTAQAKQGPGPKQQLKEWRSQCEEHEGFDLLRKSLLTDPDKLAKEELSRGYNLLRRLGVPEALKLWPSVSPKLAQMGTRELLGIWSVATEEHMVEVDALLAKALEGTTAPRTWQLLSAVSRAGDSPESATVRRCLVLLDERCKDLSSEDLALIASQLGRGAPPAFGALAQRAKEELLLRDGRLKPLQLCGLLGAMEGLEDKLWPMVRQQLLMLKAGELSAQQLLQVCRFVPQPAQDENAELLASVMKQLQQLMNSRSQPGLVAMVEQNLESIMFDRLTCLYLLNSAVRLRKDLYPAILWRLFIHTGEVDLIGRHPGLQNHLHRIGTVLEASGVGDRMTLLESAGVALAMKRGNVLLPKCTEQMAKQFVEVLARAEEMAEGSASAKHWQAEAQKLALTFWTRLKQLGVASPTLQDVFEAIRSSSRRLDSMQLMQAMADLQGVEGVDSELQVLSEEVFVELPRMSPNDLVVIAGLKMTTELRQQVALEVTRRLGFVSALRRGEDFDNTVQMLSHFVAWLHEAPLEPVTPQQLERIAGMLSDALPIVLEAEPENARSRLVAAVNVLSQLEPAALPSLCSGVHREAACGAAWPPADAADLAYGVCALHAGKLPLDMGLRLWRLAGAAVASGRPPERQSARLWAFAAAARSLSSRSMRAALAMTEEAVAMEAFLAQARQRLLPTQEATATALMSRVCAVLPRLLPEHVVEERFAVPEVPYVVDAALGRLLLLVPRTEHLGAIGLNGPGKLLQRTVEAMGWQLRWLWPEQWGAALDALEHEGREEELRGLLGAAGDPA